MQRRRRSLRLLAILLAAGAIACGDDGGGDGSGDDGQDGDGSGADAASSADARTGADAGDGDADALPATTPCPPTKGLECDSATEICMVQTPVGPAEISSCEPVPPGCEADRGCECAGAALCTGAWNVCSAGQAPNTIVCECPQCQ